MQSFKNESDISHVFSIESCIRGKFNYNEWHSWEVKELKGLFGIPDHFAIIWKKDVINLSCAGNSAIDGSEINTKNVPITTR